MSDYWHYESAMDGLAHLTLDCPGRSANVLSVAVLRELESLLTVIEAAPPRALLLRSGKPRGFIAGADINEFLKITNPAQAEAHIRWVHALFQRLAALPCPTLALIHGFCLGGGLELALACRYRIASDDPATRLGFPEVRLGLFPGYGGSVRSLACCGPRRALPLMLSGHSIPAQDARRQGLVDWVVPERQLANAARLLLQQTPAVARPPLLERLLASAPLRPLVAKYLRHHTLPHADPIHYPAPYALLDHWRRYGGDAAALYASEVREVSRLLCGETAHNLIRLFQLQERLKGLARGIPFVPRHLHVVGGGQMGGDIAAWGAIQGLRVTLQDTAPVRLSAALQRASTLFRRRLKTPRLVQAAWDRLQPDPRGDGIARADCLIEAIFEDLEAKRALFRKLETQARPEALLASNTSSLPLEELAEGLSRPQRLIGLHFFNPVAQMQLVEVIGGPATDPACLDQGLALVRRIDRLPLPVRSAPGFLVNRVLTPYLLEAVELLDEGVPGLLVDQATHAFGMPMGPVELADHVGLDICLAVARELKGHTATPSEVPAALVRLVDEGHLGRKSGRGFYLWQNGRAHKPVPPRGYRPPPDLGERLLFRLLNEAVACLREGIVADADLLDAGLVLGTGFAPFHGGPLHHVSSGGLQRMRQRLEALHAAHGEHFHPDAGWLGLGGAR